jgi:RNA polymerase sigma-70 factor (ECF subfamily)
LPAENPIAVQPDLSSGAGFASWVQPHWAAMAALAARAGQDRDDVLQNALTQAWRKRHRFDPARGSARNWLLALTADQRRKHWRRLAAETQQYQATDWDRAVLRGSDPAQSAGDPAQESHIDLERAIAKLSKRQRLAVELHYYLGLGTADTAEVMRCSQGTVKSTLSDARNKLKDLLGGDYL